MSASGRGYGQELADEAIAGLVQHGTVTFDHAIEKGLCFCELPLASQCNGVESAHQCAQFLVTDTAPLRQGCFRALLGLGPEAALDRQQALVGACRRHVPRGYSTLIDALNQLVIDFRPFR